MEMGIASLLGRLVPGWSRSSGDDPVEKANVAWRAIESRLADVDEADEYLLDRLAEYDERRRNEDEREIERSLRELRDGWTDVEGEAEAAMEYDPELERVREMARERKEEFHEQLRVFESRPEYFVEEYYWDPDDLVGESFEDDE